MLLMNELITIISDEKEARVARVESEYRFAFGMRNAARVMNNNAKITSDTNIHELNAYIVGSIILSYASLEAAFNEFMFVHALRDSLPLNSEEKAIINAIVAEELWPQGAKSTLQKFNLILRLIGKPEIKEHEKIYQAANLVRSLRNMLVHPVPGSVVTYTENESEVLSEQQKIVKQLRSFLSLEKNATFPKDVLTKSCAEFAIESCEAFLKEFVSISGISPGFIT